MLKQSCWGVALAWVGLSCAGCGGEATGSRPSPSTLVHEQCPAVPAPCGGDLEGHWEVVDYCPTIPDQDLPQCAGLVLSVISADMTGTQDFLADGSAPSSGSADFTFRVDAPQSCLAQSCSEFGQTVQENLEVTYTVTQPALCEETNDTCVCSLGVRQPVQGQGDTYQLDGSQVTIVTAQGASFVSDYCVEGNRATLVAVDSIIVLERR
jgi:hypothetical protein